ncbi:DNA repair protein RecO [uncultured Treponema sp.]|uniref:DNA repair protein RecO n=1 Tax=uncultured Treponema sp. TaxID=162155 RepID=UPI0025F2E75B|nr:DNA repair protein RecO [uncultured Treponema sp.]
MRNFSTPALILSVQMSGENNRRVTVFSPSEGIFFATLYGGPKSKMRSLVSPMNSGLLYLYRDEAKNQTKITDFDVKNYHLSFRENLFKTYAAAFVTEILIKTKCAGSSQESWKIINGFLDGIELSDENESRLGLVRFLWRYLGLLGVRPDTKSCCICASSLHSERFSGNSLSMRYVFSREENAFVCPDCNSLSERKIDFSLSKAAITYLEAVSSLSPKEVRKLTVSEKTFLEMKQLVYFLIEQACLTKLKSLESGIGIL